MKKNINGIRIYTCDDLIRIQDLVNQKCKYTFLFRGNDSYYDTPFTNVFTVIRHAIKCRFHISDLGTILGAKGEYIITGESQGAMEHNKEEYEKNDEGKRECIKSFLGITNEELKQLDLLSEQYYAIYEYTLDPTNEEKEKKVNEIYSKTQINVLSFLRDSRSEEEWMQLKDWACSYVAFMFTGKDPMSHVPIEDWERGREQLLYLVREMYLITSSMVDQIGKKQYSQANQSSQDSQVIDSVVDK